MTTILILSFLLFSIGVVGVLSRRNVIVVLMSIELMMNAANINLVAFSRYWQLRGEAGAHAGEIFAIFVVVAAAAEAVVGLAIVIALFRRRRTLAVDEIDLLKW